MAKTAKQVPAKGNKKKLDDDDGNFDFAIDLGPFTWASDIFPNAGQLATRRNGPSASILSRSVMFLTSAGREPPAWKPKNLPGW